MTRVLYQNPAGHLDLPDTERDARRFHLALDGYAPTRLWTAPEFARGLGAGHLDIKLETDRFGLPSFKVMGASWAVIEALRPYLPSWWAPEQGLTPLAGALPDLTLISATDGNHGRALARLARLLHLQAEIFVPRNMTADRAAGIESEGAKVIWVDGDYDDAVDRSAGEAGIPGKVLVSDTSWPGYEAVPAAVSTGYGTILWEVGRQLEEIGHPSPDLVLVPLGVGAFGAAVIKYFRAPGRPSPRIVGVEPTEAACVMASLAAGRRVHIPGPYDSVMAGLNCGTPSLIAWPILRDGLDAVIAVDDAAALGGVRDLAGEGLAVGECSGAVVAAARELLAGPDTLSHRARLGLPPEPSVLLFATEGVTDETAFAQTVEGTAWQEQDRHATRTGH